MNPSQVLETKVLVLNKSYMPIKTTTVMDAVSKLFCNSVEAIMVEEGNYVSYNFGSWAEISMFRKEFEADFEDINRDVDWIRTPSLHLIVPRVVRLLTYDKMPKHDVKLTRKTLYQRDRHVCQYCGDKFKIEDLNIEHIMPKSRGGQNSWENLVTACIDCNRKKGNRTPEEAGMKLIKTPRKPKPVAEARINFGRKRYKDWDHFVSTIYWNTEIED